MIEAYFNANVGPRLDLYSLENKEPTKTQKMTTITYLVGIHF